MSHRMNSMPYSIIRMLPIDIHSPHNSLFSIQRLRRASSFQNLGPHLQPPNDVPGRSRSMPVDSWAGNCEFIAGMITWYYMSLRILRFLGSHSLSSQEGFEMLWTFCSRFTPYFHKWSSITQSSNYHRFCVSQLVSEIRFFREIHIFSVVKSNYCWLNGSS